MKTFIASDHHFNHKNLLGFVRDETNRPMRNEFSTIDQMNDVLIRRHNEVVSKDDLMYFLGDVHLGKAELFHHVMQQLNGKKILILGNHDKLGIGDYSRWFTSIHAVKRVGDAILTHIPIHPESFGRSLVNIHGHLHHRMILNDGSDQPDSRYVNVSMEQLDGYRPIEINQLLET